MFNIFQKQVKTKDERKESELIVKHYYGYDRGGLVIISKNIEGLKLLEKSLNDRNIKTDLLENFVGDNRGCKLDLTFNLESSLKERVEYYLNFADTYFINKRPIPNIDYFTVNEWLILETLIG